MKAPIRLLLLLMFSLACSRVQRDDCKDGERVVDPVLLAFLSHARSAHHAADQREEQSDAAAAIRTLEAVTQGPKPAGGAPEVSEVLADTRARIAELLSRGGNFDQAEAEIVRGLEDASGPSYFRGHLFEVRGLLEERREKTLRAAGRGQDADQARERSLSAYEEAMKLQARVIENAAPGPRPAPSTE